MGRVSLLLLVVGVLLTAPPLRAEDTFTGRVVGVSTGDTLRVRRGRRELQVRLRGIDCPEGGQPFGPEAREFTSKAVFGREVLVQVSDLDRQGRALAEVFGPDGKSLNQQLVRAGMAWRSRVPTPEDRLVAEMQAEARGAKRGLWAARDPTPPWEFRPPKRAAEPEESTFLVTDSGRSHHYRERHDRGEGKRATPRKEPRSRENTGGKDSKP